MKITEPEFKKNKKKEKEKREGPGFNDCIWVGSENGENNEKRGQEEGEGGEDLFPN